MFLWHLHRAGLGTAIVAIDLHKVEMVQYVQVLENLDNTWQYTAKWAWGAWMKQTCCAWMQPIALTQWPADKVWHQSDQDLSGAGTDGFSMDGYAKSSFSWLMKTWFYRPFTEVKGSSAHANPDHMYPQRPFFHDMVLQTLHRSSLAPPLLLQLAKPFWGFLWASHGYSSNECEFNAVSFQGSHRMTVPVILGGAYPILRHIQGWMNGSEVGQTSDVWLLLQCQRNDSLVMKATILHQKECNSRVPGSVIANETVPQQKQHDSHSPLVKNIKRAYSSLMFWLSVWGECDLHTIFCLSCCSGIQWAVECCKLLSTHKEHCCLIWLHWQTYCRRMVFWLYFLVFGISKASTRCDSRLK